MRITTLIIFIFFFVISPVKSENIVINNNLKGEIKIKNWKKIRDQRIVKQNLDYSCGAASIATVLTEYYQRPTTEAEVLKYLLEVNGEKGKASFDDMEKALPKLGFRAVGLATSWEKLIDLKIPVILYVLQRKQDHFTVVSGIDDKYVKLSDPSLGNRTLTRSQFKDIWETRSEQGLEGKMLAILPLENDRMNSIDESFFKTPSMNQTPKQLLILNR